MTDKSYRFYYQISKWMAMLFAWGCWGYIVYGCFTGASVIRLILVFACSFLPYLLRGLWF